MKIKLFTHTDLDGVGCAVLAKCAFGENVDVVYCDYHNVNEKVIKFLDNPDGLYSKIIITDISVNEEVAERIEQENKGKHVFMLLDHHNTALWLNKYSWAHVESTLEGKPGHLSSGTSLLIDYLIDNQGDDTSEFMREFAEQVRRYDTWEWFNIYNDDAPKSLNLLLSILGREDFLKLMLQYSETKESPLDFDEVSGALVEQRTKETDQYIKSKLKQVKKIHFNGHTAGVVFAEKNASELGNAIASEVEGIDYAIIINLDYSSLSFRGIRDDIDLGQIAKEFGGGGHPKAAGARLDASMVEKAISVFI